jgi:hypothetical protein
MSLNLGYEYYTSFQFRMQKAIQKGFIAHYTVVAHNAEFNAWVKLNPYWVFDADPLQQGWHMSPKVDPCL